MDIKAAVPKHLTKDRGLGSRKVFVGGLSQMVTEDYLTFFFEKFGAIMETKIMFDHSTPKPHRHRGFAFVTFVEPEAADEVCLHVGVSFLPVATTVILFLDAFSHLYKRVCLSVGPSVGPSVTHELNF